jgi:hypothetical protein
MEYFKQYWLIFLSFLVILNSSRRNIHPTLNKCSYVLVGEITNVMPTRNFLSIE